MSPLVRWSVKLARYYYFFKRTFFLIKSGVVFVPPTKGIDDNLMISSICVENGDSNNQTKTVSCYDMPNEIFTAFSSAGSQSIQEFKTYLLNPLERTVLY